MSDQKPRFLASRVGGRLRIFLVAIALVSWIGFLLPPLRNLSVRYAFVEAIQFCVFAAVAPALLAVGAPWRWLGFGGADVRMGVDNQSKTLTQPHLVDRWVRARVNQPGRRRAVVLVIVFVLQSIIWRSAPVVNALTRHPWLAIVESLTLIGNGVLMWMELVESPPFSPGTSRPYRIGMAAALMWTIWVIAYLEAMSSGAWYSAFHYVSGVGVSRPADQQLTAGLMWLISAGAFLPLVFWNLIQWLQNEDDPDDELYRLVRQERTQGFFGSDD